MRPNATSGNRFGSQRAGIRRISIWPDCWRGKNVSTNLWLNTTRPWPPIRDQQERSSRKHPFLRAKYHVARLRIERSHLREVTRAGVVRTHLEQRRVGEVVERLDLRAKSLNSLVSTLSGGNQQKVLFARWLFRRPRLLIADEPTRGVDVGAKRAIYELIHSLAADGIAVLLISSEHEEVLGLAHRVLVMRSGAIVSATTAWSSRSSRSSSRSP